MSSIHSTAIVSSKAQLGNDVTIGPFCIVEDDVEIGDGTTVASHVVIANGCRIGASVTIHSGAVLGTAPQDLKYSGEPTNVFIGDRTVLREYVTVNKGTVASGRTTVGADALIMAYCHVAHDCFVGNHVVLANSVQLGGHVEVHDWAIVGGVTGVHQFVRIGAHCMIGACTRLVKDAPTYSLVAREPATVEGVNLIGIRRRGFDADAVSAIQQFYKVLFHSGLNVSAGIKAYTDSVSEVAPDVQSAIDFIQASKRGILRSA